MDLEDATTSAEATAPAPPPPPKKHYVMYDPTTMLVVSTIEEPYSEGTLEHLKTQQSRPFIECLKGEVHDMMVQVTDAENHVGSLVPRPPMPGSWDKTTLKADNTDQATLTIPNPPAAFQVFVDNEPPINVTDGVFEMVADVAGSYDIVVRALPYLDMVTVITAS